MSDLRPFLNRQPPNAKPAGQLAGPRFNPAINNLENSFNLPSKNPPIRIKFPPLPRIPPRIPGGGALGAFLLNEFLFPEAVADATIPEHLRPPEPPTELQPPTYPFRGGQGTGLYTVYIDYFRTPPFDNSSIIRRVQGTISGFRLAQVDQGRGIEPTIQVFCFGESDRPRLPNPAWISLFNNSWLERFNVTRIVADGIDTAPGVDPPPTAPPMYSPPGIYIGGPITINYGSPAPPTPLPQPLAPTTRSPSPLPDSASSPPIQQPTPIGQPTPTSTGTPEPPIAPNPTTGPTPTPTNVPPAVLYGPWKNPTPVPTSKPGYNPGFVPKFTPNPIQPHPGFTPNPIQIKPAPPISPLPGTGQPITTNNPTRTPVPVPPTTPTAPTPEAPIKSPTERSQDELINIGIGLVGVKAIADAIATNTTPEAISNAAAAGTCRTLQPGNCMSGLANNAQSAANNAANNGTKLDGINTTLNAAELGLIKVIDTKLGTQIPNIGIGGKLSNFVNWTVADRVMNLVTMFAALHNVMMLSNSVKETFLDILDNLFQTGFNVAPNLFKKSDSDEAIEAREYFGQVLDSFFGSLFGVTEWTALKAQWKAFSTIASSAAQAYNNLREIHNDSQELLNMARNYTAELGNALVDEGIISEDNWEHKDDKQKIKSKALGRLQKMGQGLEDLDNKLEAIEQVTATLLNITNTAKEIKENVEAIEKGIEEANKAAKTDRDAKIEGIELPNFSLEDLF